MTDDVQDDFVEETPVEETPVETEEQAEETTDNLDEQEQEQTPAGETEETKEEKSLRAFNKKHFEQKQAERERDEAKQELENYKLQQQQAQYQEVEIPAIPDPFDDDYDAKIIERDNAIKAAHEREFVQGQYYQNQKAQAEQAARERQAELNGVMAKCHENAKKNGISFDDLNFAANQLITAGITGEIAENLIRDDDSALLLQYLATNPMEVESIRALPPFQAAQYIERNVRNKLARPKRTSAKQPAKILKGNGGDPERSKFPMTKNARFE